MPRLKIVRFSAAAIIFGSVCDAAPVAEQPETKESAAAGKHLKIHKKDFSPTKITHL
jgi:hypothetical protein